MAIRSEDLMLGDWVFCRFNNKPARVEGISKREGAGRDGYTFILRDKNNTALFVRAISVEPIPITPEILEKNGFKQSDKSSSCIVGEYVWGGIWGRKSTTVTITFYKGLSNGVALLTKIETTCSHEGGINMVHSCDIENVHELQHALRLCGIEKQLTV